MNPEFILKIIKRPILTATALAAVSCGVNSGPKPPTESIKCADARHTKYHLEGESLSDFEQTRNEEGIYFCINLIRQSYKRAPLVMDGGLSAIAKERSRDMATKGYFSHVDLEGYLAFAHKTQAQCRLEGDWEGENLERNNIDDPVQAAVDGWIRSEKHFENMLQPHYLYVGIGETIDTNGVHFFTTVFSSEPC